MNLINIEEPNKPCRTCGGLGIDADDHTKHAMTL